MQGEGDNYDRLEAAPDSKELKAKVVSATMCEQANTADLSWKHSVHASQVAAVEAAFQSGGRKRAE